MRSSTSRRIWAATYGGRQVDNSTQWCLALLEQQNVATVMGSAFGAEGYARISFATSLETREGFDRIEAFIGRVERGWALKGSYTPMRVAHRAAVSAPAVVCASAPTTLSAPDGKVTSLISATRSSTDEGGDSACAWPECSRQNALTFTGWGGVW